MACTCHLEQEFAVYEDGPIFEVRDAELELVAMCVQRDYADLIVAALGAFGDDNVRASACVDHPDGFIDDAAPTEERPRRVGLVVAQVTVLGLDILAEGRGTSRSGVVDQLVREELGAGGKR